MGWAAGFQAGSQVARNALDAYYGAKERREIEDLNKQAPETYEGVSPQNQQFLKNVESAVDAQGNPVYQLDQATPGKFGLSVRNAEGGYTPVEGPGISTPREQRVRYLGREYGAEQFNPDVQRSARTQALTDIVSKYRPEAGVRLGLEAQKATDEAEARQYGIRQRPQQEALTQAQIDSATAAALSAGARAKADERIERSAQISEDFDAVENKFRADNPNATAADLIGFANKSGLNRQQLLDYSNRLVGFGKNELAQKEIKEGLDFHDFMAEFASKPDQDPYALAEKRKLSPDNYKKVFQSMTGATDAQVADAQAKINAAVSKAKNLDGILKSHKDDKLIDPNSHYVRGTDDKGNLTLTMVNTATGEPTGQPLTFKNDLDAFEYLTNAAKSPQALFSYVSNKRKSDLDEGWKEAQIKGEDAKTAYVDQQRKGLPAQAQLWTEQANHVKAQTAVIADESKAKIGLMKAQGRSADASANLHNAQGAELGKVKASNIMPLVNDTTGDVILVDVTKMERNANGSLAVPNGYKPQKVMTDQQKASLEGYNKILAADTTLLEPANAAKREALIVNLGLQGIVPVRGINPGSGTDRLGPGGLNAPPRAGAAAPAAAPVPAYSNTSLPITDRITAAVNADRSAGNNYELGRLQQEAQTTVPQIRSQIATLKSAMDQSTPEQKKSNQAKIDELEKSLTAYSGLLPQPTGLR